MSRDLSRPASSREWLNPLDEMRLLYGIDPPMHITFDPSVVPQYRIIRSGGGDGLVLYTQMMFDKALRPLVEQTTFFNGTEPSDWSRVREIRYTVGLMRHATVSGMIMLRCGGPYPGQHERVTIPVRCDYILNPSADA